MKKVYMLDELDCANCAAKMQNEISKLPEIESVTVSFLSQKLTFETNCDDTEYLLEKIQAIITKIEPDCRVIK